MIINERDDEVLIDLNDFVVITKLLGLHHKRQTYHLHVKNGKIQNGIYANGKSYIWTKRAIYEAVFGEKPVCPKCAEYKATLKNISILSNTDNQINNVADKKAV